MKRCASTPALTIFVVYAPTSIYEEGEIEAFYMDLEKFYREDHAFYKVIIGDLNAKVGPRRTPEELHIGTHGLQWNDQGERLSEFIMTTKIIHGNSQYGAVRAAPRTHVRVCKCLRRGDKALKPERRAELLAEAA
ncbi:hypothetical protein NECAME_06953 [Necator americanus]|uniref:Endonuclease/exonuclease/phosphatase domain-containing protein n=1 Tax=Necator americanus TaxID=51031 RepID=W2TQE2_NECAM|nr:hypothetical protein NECAME_06953 [Necator americanus]ETN84265.1 hypothetical protein NECAME_06953 [Necator americanus]